MHQLESDVGWLNAQHQYISLMHENDKLIVFERGDLLFVFNFHPHKSWEHYRIGTCWSSQHIILLHTDEVFFILINLIIFYSGSISRKVKIEDRICLSIYKRILE